MPDKKKKKEKEMKLFRNKTEKFVMFLFQKKIIYLLFFVITFFVRIIFRRLFFMKVFFIRILFIRAIRRNF